MKLAGLYTINPHDEDLIVKLATFAGPACLEEPWTLTLLEGLPPESAGRDRKRYLAEAFVMNEIATLAPYEGAYCLEDGSALALAVLKSDLGGVDLKTLEADTARRLKSSVLSDDEAECLKRRLEAMQPISNFTWTENRHDGDAIYFSFFAVDPAHRESGAFRNLITPFLIYADAHGIPCYLETYAEQLVGLYEHFGFKVVETFESPDFAVTEYAMKR